MKSNNIGSIEEKDTEEVVIEVATEALEEEVKDAVVEAEVKEEVEEEEEKDLTLKKSMKRERSIISTQAKSEEIKNDPHSSQKIPELIMKI